LRRKNGWQKKKDSLRNIFNGYMRASGIRSTEEKAGMGDLMGFRLTILYSYLDLLHSVNINASRARAFYGELPL
jgi:hypothetical protein